VTIDSMQNSRNASKNAFNAVKANSGATAADEPDGLWLRFGGVTAAIYWAIHASCLLAIYTGVNAVDVALCLGLFWLRLFGITGGFHRYFAHRSFKTGRVVQFLLAFLGTSAIQKGPLWWAGTHRVHHRHSDQPGDPHSPKVSFWHSHQGWIFEEAWGETRLEEIKDFAKFPELVWLNQWHVVPPLLMAFACYAIGGFSGLVWGVSISTVICWHATYSINSLSHRLGSTRFDTGDDSKNNLFLALLTLGEGWHNNHHRFMNSTRQGFYWWEIDITYYLLRLMSSVGLVWDMKTPPASVYAEASANRAARSVAASAKESAVDVVAESVALASRLAADPSETPTPP
jgi:stearoyl-CoA desaturase (delta-9 desaturase)